MQPVLEAAPSVYETLLSQIEAERQVLHQAMVDLEKSETELRAAYDPASRSQAD